MSEQASLAGMSDPPMDFVEPYSVDITANNINVDGGSSPSPSRQSRIHLLDLPGEVLSQIASCLPFGEVIPFLSLNSTLLSLTRSHLSPFPDLIRQALQSGQPYPPVMACLPSLSLFQQANDSGQMYLPILIRARPRWIVERFEHGRWKDRIWKEAFEKRFLKSWERFKMEQDSWRAIFLRLLGRLEHRFSGCTHDEAWTRFITLHRNGSASLNRIYSRTFDPYEIYDELKHQNNFSSQPTQVRVLLHLQDIRILAIGVLYSQPSLFVNPNAHLLLHPPLLRSTPFPDTPPEPARYRPPHRSSSPAIITQAKPVRTSASPSASATTNEAYFPSIRSPSPNSSLSPTAGNDPLSADNTTAAAGPSTGTRRSTLSVLRPSRPRRLSQPILLPTVTGSQEGSDTGPEASSSSKLGNMLSPPRGNESETQTRNKRWSFGRSRTNSFNTPTIQASAIFPELRLVRSADRDRPKRNRTETSSGPQSPLPILAERSDTSLPLSNHSRDRTTDEGLTPKIITHLPTPPTTPPSVSRRARKPLPRLRLPYPRLQVPQPSLSHVLYPNFTPSPPSVPKSDQPTDEDNETENPIVPRSDFRNRWEEVDDDIDGALWAAGGEDAWPDGRRMAEWDPEKSIRRRWVGPMIIVAQLFPCDRKDPHPPGSNSIGPIEGPDIDLGPKGMYASIGFEDMESLMGWVELRGGGAHSSEALRPGLGF